MSKQNKLVAKLRQQEIANKRRPLQESGALKSQWGTMTAESKLLERGHFLKTGDRARLDFVREEVRKQKAKNNADKGQVIITIKR